VIIDNVRFIKLKVCGFAVFLCYGIKRVFSFFGKGTVMDLVVGTGLKNVLDTLEGRGNLIIPVAGSPRRCNRHAECSMPRESGRNDRHGVAIFYRMLSVKEKIFWMERLVNNKETEMRKLDRRGDDRRVGLDRRTDDRTARDRRASDRRTGDRRGMDTT
jgi:hypothetical protein